VDAVALDGQRVHAQGCQSSLAVAQGQRRLLQQQFQLLQFGRDVRNARAGTGLDGE
jgi:hypothetical protein